MEQRDTEPKRGGLRHRLPVVEEKHLAEDRVIAEPGDGEFSIVGL